MKTKTKVFIGIEVLIIVAIFSFIILNKPNLISPPSGFVIQDMNFSFDFENADQLIIATNPDFENPIILDETREIELPPGTYYWKAKGLLRESEIRDFTIVTHVAVRLGENGERYILSNEGNVDLNITSGENSSVAIIVGDSQEFEKINQSFEGRQK